MTESIFGSWLSAPAKLLFLLVPQPFFLFHCRNELPKQREVLVPSMPNTRQGSQKMRQACNKPYFVCLQAALTEMQIMSVKFNHRRVTYDKSKGLLYPQIHSKCITETLVTQLFSAYFIISNILLYLHLFYIAYQYRSSLVQTSGTVLDTKCDVPLLQITSKS